MPKLTDPRRVTLSAAAQRADTEKASASKKPQPRKRPGRATRNPAASKSKATPKSTNGQSPPAVRPGTKQALLIDLLKRKTGATLDEAVAATGWRPHSVRGAISGALRKKLGLTVESGVVEDRGRVYRIVGRG